MFQQLTSWENLHTAWRKAAKGKRGNPSVGQFEFKLEENLLRLHRELSAGTYRPGNYVTFTIHEPKRRVISAAPFRDRVVHHALCNVIEPDFERSFIYDSYANRVGKGTHKALDRCQTYSRKYRYVLQCDVQQFFPSLDHEVLKQILWRKVDDPQVRWLIDQIIHSGAHVLKDEYQMRYFAGDDLLAVNRPRGLPIGNLTSQFWANCYLNHFDHFIKQGLRCPAYIRFVDDFLLFSNSKRSLWHWKESIIEQMARLRLTIHPGAHPRPATEGIPILGFIVFPHKRRLKSRRGHAFRRKFNRLVDEYQQGLISIDVLHSSVQGWVNHTRYANTVGLRKAILSKGIHLKH